MCVGGKSTGCGYFSRCRWELTIKLAYVGNVGTVAYMGRVFSGASKVLMLVGITGYVWAVFEVFGYCGHLVYQ